MESFVGDGRYLWSVQQPRSKITMYVEFFPTVFLLTHSLQDLFGVSMMIPFFPRLAANVGASLTTAGLIGG